MSSYFSGIRAQIATRWFRKAISTKEQSQTISDFLKIKKVFSRDKNMKQP